MVGNKKNKLTQLINPKTDGNDHMIYEETEDNEGNEIIARREVEVEGKNKYTLQATDPYGHWKVISSDGKKLPKELEGTYTSAVVAQRAIETYLNRV